MVGLFTGIDGDTLGGVSATTTRVTSFTLTRPDDTKEIGSILRLEPDIGFLSAIVWWVISVWHISDGGIRHED